MTLLTICQNVVDAIGVEQVSTIVGNAERAERRLLSMANIGGKSMAKMRWSVLVKEAEITTVASQPDYALPADFAYIVADTAWDRTNYWRMRGGLTPQEWQVQKSAIIATNEVRKEFRIKPDSNAKKIFIDPTPTAVETLVYEYGSSYWCQSSAGTGQVKWTADDDTGILDEDLLELDLLWRYRSALGLSYIDERKDAEDRIKQAFAQDGGMRTLRPEQRSEIWPVNVPEANFG